MNLNLNGKTILFIGPETFNYEKEIVSELKHLGAQVVYRSDKPGTSFILKVLLRLFPRILWRYSDKIFKQWLAASGPANCDIVWIIKGEGLSPKFIGILRQKYVNAHFVYYLWDSINNVRDAATKFSKFDRVYSFDPQDCQRYKALTYRPLFFLERYRSSMSRGGNGCFFIGTLNGDRPTVIKRLLRILPEGIEFNYWLFIRNRVELIIRRVFDFSLRALDRSRLLDVPMPSSVVGENFQRSAAIVDIEHPNQVGLTMRTFEVLASGKKLITTNKNIISHDFYDPSRICVIDRDNPNIDPAFFDSTMEPLSASFYDKYSLNGWVSDILGCACVKQGDK